MTTTAKQYIRQKSVMPTTAKSRELQQLSPDITERALFSATVDKADLLARVQELTGRMVDPSADGSGQKVNKTVFREKMRNLLGSMGYEINPDGGLTDITSTKRLNLIASMITQEAQGYSQFVQANDPAILDAFPAQELFRLHHKKAPRDWYAKWVAAGGKLYGGRMIALKDDPIWSKRLEAGGFNRFGRAWPPFDFNSGMWIKPVTRGEAVRLGVCSKTEIPKQQKRTYNADLQQSCTTMTPSLYNALREKVEVVMEPVNKKASVVRPASEVDRLGKPLKSGQALLPLHEVRDQDKFEAITQHMIEHGWEGRPVLVIDQGDHYQAITGSHRIAAAKEAGIAPKIYVIEQPPFAGDYEQQELFDALISGRDEEREAAISKLVERGDIPSDVRKIMDQENEL